MNNILTKYRYEITLVLIILLGLFFRSFNISENYAHPDEEIPVAVIAYMVDNHTFDTSMKNIESFPDLFKECGYNFSSYIMASYFYINAADLLLPEVYDNIIHSIKFLRLFSLIQGVISLLLLYFLCVKFFNKRIALTASCIYSFTLLAVQDSHYARIENFLVLITIGMLFGILGDNENRKNYYGPAFLLGILFSGKITMLIFGVLFVGKLIYTWYDSRLSLKDFIVKKRIPSLIITSVCWFIIGVFISMPYAFINISEYINSMVRLQKQYGGIHIPHSSASGDIFFATKCIIKYLWASLGIISVLPLLYICIIKRIDRRSFLLFSVCCVYLLIFSFQKTFFERNLSMIMPMYIILAAQILDYYINKYCQSFRFHWVYVPVVIILSIVPFINCYKFSVIALVPDDRVIQVQSQLLQEYDKEEVLPVTILIDDQAQNVIKTAQKSQDKTIFKIISYNDDFTEKNMVILLRNGFREIYVIDSIFNSFPVCTLYTYHCPKIIYMVKSN